MRNPTVRVSRRERELRRYYLRAVVQRMGRYYDPATYDLAGAFATDPATLADWLSGRTPAPAWIPALAISAYGIAPPPPAPRIPRLVRWILLTVAAGAGAVLALSRL